MASQRQQKTKWKHSSKIMKYANISMNDTLDELKVPSLGLTEKYVKSRSREIEKKKGFPYFKYVMKSFEDIFTLILVAIIVYNFVMYGIDNDSTYLAGGLLVTVLILISVLFDIFTNRSIWKSNVKLGMNNIEYSRVLRNVILNKNTIPFSNTETEQNMIERLTEIKTKDLLRGDIIYLKKGDIVPVDAKIIYSTEFSVDQEILIGSNIPMHKKYFNSSLSSEIFYLSNIIYRGTKVTNGNAWAIVLYKGHQTFYENKIISEVPDRSKSNFNVQVKKVTRILIYTLIAFVPTIFVLVGLLSSANSGFSDPKVWISSVVFAMAIAIALSPDSLPLMLNAAFSRSRIVLSRKKILVKSLTSIQNIGSMDVMAIDGEKIFLNKEYIISNYHDINNYNNKKIMDYMVLSFLYDPLSDIDINNAILTDPENLKRIKELKDRYIFKDKINLNSVTYLHFLDQQLDKELILRRDNFDSSIANAKFYDDGKKIEKLSSTKKRSVISQIERTFLSLGIDYKYLTKKDITHKDKYVNDFIYLGKVNLINTVKAGSSSIIKQIEKEDISVVLFSRKPLNETLALAKELDFNVSGAISGNEVDKMNDSQLIKKLKQVNIFYGLDLLTEVRIIKVYKKNKNTIGFLGKDIEDSFQLLNADIGITLDSSDFYGKKCASLVVSHLDLMQLMTSITESRKALINMMKYIKLKTTGTISLTMKLLIGIVMLNHEPMTAIQLLVQNMIYDLVEYTIIFDNVNEQYILKPVKWKPNSIIPFASFNGSAIVLINVAMVLITSFGIYPHMFTDIRNEKGDWENELKILQTTYFIEDSISHLIFIFVARDNYVRFWNSRPNKILFWSLLAGIAFFIVVPLIPQADNVFDAAAPSWKWYLMLIAGMVLMLGYVDIVENTYLKKKKNWF